MSPLVDDDVAVEIDEADLRIDTYRSQGAGGQHVNKTDSAVRITHLPTGIVVQCQNERSQLQNKAQAMRILTSRLIEREREEREQTLAAERGEAQDISFGSQIRSYVLHPYTMVNDHRTNLKIGNAQGVLDGDLDELHPCRAATPRGGELDRMSFAPVRADRYPETRGSPVCAPQPAHERRDRTPAGRRGRAHAHHASRRPLRGRSASPTRPRPRWR